jgi:hypothetical protein
MGCLFVRRSVCMFLPQWVSWSRARALECQASIWFAASWLMACLRIRMAVPHRLIHKYTAQWLSVCMLVTLLPSLFHLVFSSLNIFSTLSPFISSFFPICYSSHFPYSLFSVFLLVINRFFFFKSFSTSYPSLSGKCHNTRQYFDVREQFSRSEILGSYRVKITYWGIAACSLLEACRRFGGGKYHWHVGLLVRDYTALYPSRPLSSISQKLFTPWTRVLDKLIFAQLIK